MPRGMGWFSVVSIALITLIPIGVVASALLHPDPVLWSHLWDFVLPELLVNTVWLVLGVGIGVSILGVGLAWLTALCDFPGRRFFSWALLLPLALPAYISAFVWLGLFDSTGTVTLWLRDAWGLHLPAFRSRGGVILVLTLALYPYVYLTARAAFLGQGARLLEAAQSLGHSRRQAFWSVALPMARPGIMAGLILALMETLADFGTVVIFNYNTFTTAIYKAWFSLFSLSAASQLAAILVFFVFVALLLEGQWRNRQQTHAARSSQNPQRIVLRGRHALIATLAASGIWGLAFVLPVLQLLAWAWAARADLDARYLDFASHSLLLSTLGAFIILCLALIVAYAQRLNPGPAMRTLTRAATLGYALPGAVLAVGIYLPITMLDKQMIDSGWIDAPYLQGTLIVMLLAYSARFMAVSFNPIEAGLGQVSRSMDEVAQILGVTGIHRLWRVHLPLLRPSLLAAAALTFVDIMKELPITLMTRPFGWDTLAVRVFEMTSEGEWERAALPAIAIVVVGLIPVFLLTKTMGSSQHHALAC
jgi:iron(III) transport system permease protein